MRSQLFYKQMGLDKVLILANGGMNGRDFLANGRQCDQA
jgi:hypothetical protein